MAWEPKNISKFTIWQFVMHTVWAWRIVGILIFLGIRISQWEQKFWRRNKKFANSIEPVWEREGEQVEILEILEKCDTTQRIFLYIGSLYFILKNWQDQLMRYRLYIFITIVMRVKCHWWWRRLTKKWCCLGWWCLWRIEEGTIASNSRPVWSVWYLVILDQH